MRIPALTAMEENNFFGKTVPQEPSPHRMGQRFRQTIVRPA